MLFVAFCHKTLHVLVSSWQFPIFQFVYVLSISIAFILVSYIIGCGVKDPNICIQI